MLNTSNFKIVQNLLGNWTLALLYYVSYFFVQGRNSASLLWLSGTLVEVRKDHQEFRILPQERRLKLLNKWIRIRNLVGTQR